MIVYNGCIVTSECLQAQKALT